MDLLPKLKQIAARREELADLLALLKQIDTAVKAVPFAENQQG